MKVEGTAVITNEDAVVEMLTTAKTVTIVPGYGLAVS